MRIKMRFMLLCFLGQVGLLSISGQNDLQDGFLRSNVTDESGYDVLKYKLEFHSNPKSPVFSGKTTVYFNVLEATNQIELDAEESLQIQEVVYRQQAISSFSHQNEKLIITLPSVLNQQANDSLSVSFTGIAESSSGYHVSSVIFNDSKERFAACTFSESKGTPKSWWVCKDGLTDKADEIELHITHPSAYKAVANGLLQSVKDHQNGFTTTVWKHQYPIPPYLVALAVAEYQEYPQTMKMGDTEMPILNYIYPGRSSEEYQTVLDKLDKTPSYILGFNELYGEYPFKTEKYGHAEWFFGGAMEHSTLSFMHSSWDESVIIHELAHHWFGNQITCNSWSDIWLNEGFATYSEALMYELQKNQEAYDRWFPYKLHAILERAKQGSVYNPEPDNPDRTFDVVYTYYKAGMVVHQLRSYIGDQLFFQAIRQLLKEEQFNFVSTEHFKQRMMELTGKDLTEFFKDWIYGEGYPVFDLTVTRSVGNEFFLTVDQTQTHPSVSFFETSFKVEFIGDNGQSVIKMFDLTHNHQTFHVTDLSFPIKEVRFNPHADLIAVENKITVKNEAVIVDEVVSVVVQRGSQQLQIVSQKPILGGQIFDLSGKLIWSIKGANTSYLIPMTGWNPGVYVVKLDTEKGVVSQKIMK